MSIEVIDTRSEHLIYAESLSLGDTFMYNDELYIKTVRVFETRGESTKAFNLSKAQESTKNVTFKHHELVKPVNVQIRIID